MLASKVRRTHLTQALLMAWAVSCSAGCTLITDVDRSRILTETPPPTDTADSGAEDDEPPAEPGADAAAPDAAADDDVPPDAADAGSETDASP